MEEKITHPGHQGKVTLNPFNLSLVYLSLSLSLSPLPPSSALQEEEEPKEFADVVLSDLVRVETLGMGGFGRVELVCDCCLISLGCARDSV